MSITMTSRSGPDGKLRLEVPVSQPGVDYQVVISVQAKPRMTAAEWPAWVARTAGLWQGDYERPEPLPPQEREPF